jgi:hypothetical protein
MLSLRTSALVCGGFFALMIGLAVLGNFVPPATFRNVPWLQTAAKIVFVTLVVVFVFSFVPLMVNVVFGAQTALGNQARLASVFRLRVAIVWVIWGLLAAGMLVAIPAAIRSGAFGDARGPLVKRPLARSQGKLVARPGMTVADIRHASTLDLAPDAARYGTVSASDSFFDYQVAETPTVFHGCDEYTLTLDEKTERVTQVHVSLFPDTIGGAELGRFLYKTRARLRADGWTARDEYRFSRGATTLQLSRQRMDEWHAGDARDAGRWNAFVDVVPGGAGRLENPSR